MRDASLALLLVSAMLAVQARELESLEERIKEAEAAPPYKENSFAKQLHMRSQPHTTDRPVIIVTVTPDDVERGTVTQTRGTVTFTHTVTTTTTTTTVTTNEHFDSMMSSNSKSLSADGAWMWLCFGILASFWIFIIICCCCMSGSRKQSKRRKGVDDDESLKRGPANRDVQLTAAAPTGEASPLLSHVPSHIPSVSSVRSQPLESAQPVQPSVPALPPTPLMDLLAPRGSFPSASSSSFSGARSPHHPFPMTTSFAQHQPAAASGYHIPLATSSSFAGSFAPTSAAPSYASPSPSYTSPLAMSQQSLQYSGRLSAHHLH